MTDKELWDLAYRIAYAMSYNRLEEIDKEAKHQFELLKKGE